MTIGDSQSDQRARRGYNQGQSKHLHRANPGRVPAHTDGVGGEHHQLRTGRAGTRVLSGTDRVVDFLRSGYFDKCGAGDLLDGLTSSQKIVGSNDALGGIRHYRVWPLRVTLGWEQLISASEQRY
jgi:hypothetical protein